MAFFGRLTTRPYSRSTHVPTNQWHIVHEDLRELPWHERLPYMPYLRRGVTHCRMVTALVQRRAAAAVSNIRD